MSELTDIVLLVRSENAVLMEQTAVDADLDAGHWRLPVLAGSADMAQAHPAFCGVDASHAASLQTWLKAQSIEFSRVSSCQAHSAQCSPAWHPARQNLQVYELHLASASQASSEPARYSWQTPEAWLDQWRNGEILLNPLSQGLLEHGGQFNWSTIESEQTLHAVEILPTRSHTLPPASHTNTLLLGEDDDRWLIDPSPANAQARDELIRRIGERRLAGIFLTHHHGDHHQQAVTLAQHFQVPIRCSADTRERIPQRFGANYWQGSPPDVIDDSAVLCHWKSQPVRVHAVPGHDAGQLALMPENRQWILVGDLIQGIGTVVIARPEGDMADYFASLQWVIAQQPAAIIPSHGQVMGSAYRIEQTLAHRQLREEQILQLHQQDLDPQDMVSIIYAGVDKRLWGLARMNIDCHLDKLRTEQRI